MAHVFGENTINTQEFILICESHSLITTLRLHTHILEQYEFFNEIIRENIYAFRFCTENFEIIQPFISFLYTGSFD